MSEVKLCKIADCESHKKSKKGKKVRIIKGFCEKHYKRYFRGKMDEDGKWLDEDKPLKHTGKKKYKKCKIRGCTRDPGSSKYYIKGFCSLHYSRFKAGIIDEDGKKIRDLKKGLHTKCKIRGCNGDPDPKGRYRKGFCYRHYMQHWKKNIDINGKVINPDFKPRKG